MDEFRIRPSYVAHIVCKRSPWRQTDPPKKGAIASHFMNVSFVFYYSCWYVLLLGDVYRERGISILDICQKETTRERKVFLPRFHKCDTFLKFIYINRNGLGKQDALLLIMWLLLDRARWRRLMAFDSPSPGLWCELDSPFSVCRAVYTPFFLLLKKKISCSLFFNFFFDIVPQIHHHLYNRWEKLPSKKARTNDTHKTSCELHSRGFIARFKSRLSSILT